VEITTVAVGVEEVVKGGREEELELEAEVAELESVLELEPEEVMVAEFVVEEEEEEEEVVVVELVEVEVGGGGGVVTGEDVESEEPVKDVRGPEEGGEEDMEAEWIRESRSKMPL